MILQVIVPDHVELDEDLNGIVVDVEDKHGRVYAATVQARLTEEQYRKYWKNYWLQKGANEWLDKLAAAPDETIPSYRNPGPAVGPSIWGRVQPQPAEPFCSRCAKAEAEKPAVMPTSWQYAPADKSDSHRENVIRHIENSFNSSSVFRELKNILVYFAKNVKWKGEK